LAVGFFFGVSLLWGLQILLAVLVSHFVRGNKVLAAAMTAISNPLTNLPLYGLSYVIGHVFVGGPEQFPALAQLTSLSGIAALGPRFLGSLLVGTTLLGLVGAVAVYLGAQRILAALQRWHGKGRPVRPAPPPRRARPARRQATIADG
jgi:uncharacterized protein (DUF2062 family)